MPHTFAPLYALQRPRYPTLKVCGLFGGLLAAVALILVVESWVAFCFTILELWWAVRSTRSPRFSIRRPPVAGPQPLRIELSRQLTAAHQADLLHALWQAPAQTAVAVDGRALAARDQGMMETVTWLLQVARGRNLCLTFWHHSPAYTHLLTAHADVNVAEADIQAYYEVLNTPSRIGEALRLVAVADAALPRYLFVGCSGDYEQPGCLVADKAVG